MGRITQEIRDSPEFKAGMGAMMAAYFTERMQIDKRGGQLLYEALQEHRAAPDTPLDKRPALDELWRWLVREPQA